MTRVLTTLALGAFVFGLAFGQPDEYALPGEAVYPEGIATTVDGGTFYTGSTTSGTIFQGDVESGEVTVFAEGMQPSAIGVEVDPRGRVWVAGGSTGNVYVYAMDSGELLQTYETPDAEATFLNDLALVEGHVYVTDSMRPVLFRIGAGNELGELEEWVNFDGTVLEYQEGINLNGIEPTPDRSAVIAIHMGTGELYRIALEDGSVSQVDLGGDTLPAGDGLVRSGDTVYVTRNTESEVARIELTEDDGSAGEVGESITSDAFRFPTTAAIGNGSLLVVNSQFDQQGEGGEPELPFSVVRVPLD